MKRAFVAPVHLFNHLTLPFTEVIQEHTRNRKLKNDDRKHLPVLERLSAMLHIHDPSLAQIEIDEDAVKQMTQHIQERINVTNAFLEILSRIRELDKTLESLNLRLYEPNITQNRREQILLEIGDIRMRRLVLWEEAEVYIEWSVESV